MNFFIKKLIIVIPTLYIAWTVVFVTLNIIPGDPVNLMLGGRPASEEVRENVRKNLGLDKPVAERYVSFLINATKGDLGKSYLTRQPVTKMIMKNEIDVTKTLRKVLSFAPNKFFSAILKSITYRSH